MQGVCFLCFILTLSVASCASIVLAVVQSTQVLVATMLHITRKAELDTSTNCEAFSLIAVPTECQKWFMKGNE